MSDKSEKRGTDKKPPSDPRKPGNTRTDANDSQNPPSLASRIQSSASGLARNAFFATGASADAAQVLSSGSGSKAGPSASAATAALAAAEQYRGTSAPASSAREQSAHHPADSFRSSSTSTGQHGAFELPPLTEDEFQHTYDDTQLRNDIDFRALTDTYTDTGKGKGKGKQRTSSTNAGASPTIDTDAYTTQQSSLPSDGAAVIALLSDSAFDPEFPETAEEPFEPIETDLLPPQLTPSEIEMIESFRRQAALPPSATTTQPHPHRLTSLSLVPDIDSILDSVPAGTATDAAALRDAVLTNLPGAADWVAVEERYHDEVWGYLRPTLEAAAKEMEAKEDLGVVTDDGPAVRRLKMILRHMQI